MPRIRTPWDKLILKLEDRMNLAISLNELQHPQGLRDLSYLAEGFRRGYEAAQSDFAKAQEANLKAQVKIQDRIQSRIQKGN